VGFEYVCSEEDILEKRKISVQVFSGEMVYTLRKSFE
jgi:hypothetical protein